MPTEIPVFANAGVAHFSGNTTDVINLAHDPSLEIAQGTIALSFQTDQIGGRQGILSKDASGSAGGGNHFTLYLEDDVLRAYFSDGTASRNLEVANIVAGQEYEVAATFNADGIELFVNGVSQASSPWVSMSWETNQEYLQIGAIGWGSETGGDRFGYPFTGAIADVEIYSSVLGAGDITELANTSSLGSSGGNNDPIAIDDVATTIEGTPVTIDVIANDSDLDGDALNVSAVSQAANGSVTDNGNGTVTYTPGPGFTGSDTFTYDIDDGNGGTDTATVSVSVVEPSGTVFANPGVALFSGSSSDVINLAHDPILEISQGTIALSFRADEIDGRQGILSKDASGSTGGGNHFTLYLQDDVLRAYFADGTASRTLDVANIVAGQEYEVAATFNADGIELFVDGVSQATSPWVSMSWETNQEYLQIGAIGWGSETGAPGFGYPFTGAIADVEIYGQVLDQAAISDLAQTSSLGGGGGNVDPIALDDTATTDEDVAVFIDVLANDSDADGDPLDIVEVTQGSNGSVAIDAGGVTYTPEPGFSGTDSFTYTIDDGNGGSDTGTVNVTVTGDQATGVVFANPGVATFSGSSADVINLAHDPNLEIAQGTIALSFRADEIGGRQGILSKDAMGSTGGGNHFTLYLQDDVLRAYFSDGTASRNLDVANIVAGQEYEVAATFNADGIELFIDGVSQASSPYVSMSWETNQEYLQIGALGWGSETGGDRFGYPFTGAIADVEIYDDVLDAAAISDLAQTSSLGGGGNSDPVAVDDTGATDEDTEAVVDVLANDTDADGDPLTVSAIDGTPISVGSPVALASGALVSLNADATLSYDPNGAFDDLNDGDTATDSFAYTIQDGNGGTATATATVSVNGISPSGSAPVATNLDLTYVDAATSETESLFFDTATNVTVFARDLVAELATDADTDLTSADITFTSATLDGGQVVSLADIGFSYLPGTGDSGTLSFLNASAPAFAGLVAGEEIGVTVTYIVTDGVNSAEGVLTYEVEFGDINDILPVTDASPSALELDVTYLGALAPSEQVTAQSGLSQTAATAAIAAGGNLDLEDLFDGNFLDAIAPAGTDPGNVFALTSARAEDIEPIGGVTLAASAAAGETNATATASDGSIALAQSATSGYLATATAENASVATAQAVDSGSAVADASFGSKASAKGENFGTAQATAYDESLAIAEATFESSATASADGYASSAIAFADVISVATASGSEGSSAEATATNQSEANAAAVNDSSATAISDGISSPEGPYYAIADARAFDTSTSFATALNDNPGGGFPPRASEATAISESGSQATALSTDSSITTADASSGSVAESSATDVSSATATATLGTTAQADASAFAGDEASATTVPVIVDVTPDAQTITFSGLPAGSSMSAGTPNVDGTAVTITGPLPANLTLTTPAGFSGDFQLTATAVDASGNTAETNQTVTINEGAQNTPPIANDDSETTDEDVATFIDVLVNDNDADDDLLVITSVTQGANGTVVIDDGGVIYTPNANFNGSDSFTYAIDDGNGGTDTATVSVTVTPVNDAPVAVNDSYSGDQDTLLDIAAAAGLLVNDSDVDDDLLTAQLVTGPANGGLILNTDGSFSYTPNAGFSGSDSFTYVANDGTVDSAPATVTIDIAGGADPIQFTANQAAPGTVDRPHAVLVEDFDFDGDQDILIAATNENRLIWLENDGAEAFTRRDLPADLVGAYELTIADLDEDGDLDLLGVAFNDTLGVDVIWYEQQADPVTGAPTFVSHQVNTSDLGAAHSVEVADIDGVGGLDIVVAAQNDSTVYWYANDGSENFTENTVDTGLSDVRIADVGDIDGDGDIDIVSAVQGASEVVWHENNGSGSFTTHVVGTAATVNSVVIADINGDGSLDIASADSGENMVKVFLNNDDGSGADLSFSEALVFDHGAVGLFSIAADDIDGDGDIDLMSAARTTGEIFWYEQQDDGSWITQTVFDGTGQMIDVGSGDVDSDGDIDIVSADQAADIVYWFENDTVI